MKIHFHSMMRYFLLAIAASTLAFLLAISGGSQAHPGDNFVSLCRSECVRIHGEQSSSVCALERIRESHKVMNTNKQLFHTCITEEIEPRERCIEAYRKVGMALLRDMNGVCPSTYTPIHNFMFGK